MTDEEVWSLIAERDAALARVEGLREALRGLLVVIDACDRANVVPNAKGEKAQAARAALAGEKEGTK